MVRLSVLASLLLLAGAAQARELKVLTGAGLSMPVRELAADYQARTGVTVTVVSDTAGGVQKRVAGGERYDLVIATTTVADALTQGGKLAAQHRQLARMVAGIGARAGTPRPAIDTAEQVKATLLAAKSISYVDPASGGITGVFFLSQADRLGIGGAVRAKAVLKANGTGVADAVAAGEAQYGVTLTSEMLPNKGVTVWKLPDALQMTTVYAGALTTDAANAQDADALLAALSGPPGHDAALRAGLMPLN